MSASRPIPTEDLALYAMQALSPEEMESVAAALRESPEARQQLASLQGDLALLSLSSEQQAAPAGSLDRLMARVRTESGKAETGKTENGKATQQTMDSSVSAAPAISPVRTPVPDDSVAPVLTMRRRSVWAVAAPWAIAAALAIGCFVLGAKNSSLNDALNDEVHQVSNLAAKASRAQQVLEVLNAPNAQRVTLTAAKTPPTPTAHTIYLADRGALVMQADNLKPVAAGKTYELWVIPASGAAPVPAGTFTPNGAGYASLVLPKLPGGVAAKAFGITVENAGGAQTPTMPILLSGE